MIPLTLLNLFMKLYTPIKYRQEKCIQWVYSWIPTYILQVMYIPEQSSKLTEIYCCTGSSSWPKQTQREFKEGFYVFNYWNGTTYKMERLVFHSNHLMKALHIDSLDVLWMFDEAALVHTLNDYVKHTSNTEIIDLFLNKKTVYKSMSPYKQCMGLPKNMTARILYLMYQCEMNLPIDEKEEDDQVTYFTSTLEEYVVKHDDYLVG